MIHSINGRNKVLRTGKFIENARGGTTCEKVRNTDEHVKKSVAIYRNLSFLDAGIHCAGSGNSGSDVIYSDFGRTCH